MKTVLNASPDDVFDILNYTYSKIEDVLMEYHNDECHRRLLKLCDNLMIELNESEFIQTEENKINKEINIIL